MTKARVKAIDKPLRFSISEVGKIFGKSVHWLRWRERVGHFKLPDGELIEPSRRSEKEAAKRLYTVEDVENMAFSLLRRESITYEDYQRIKTLVNSYPKPKEK